MKKKVIDLWEREYLPILEIARRLNLSKTQVMNYLGEKYTKNEGHYRATKFRDQKRMNVLENWYQNDFNQSELNLYAENGQLTEYYLKIYHQTKVSVNEVRKFLTRKKVVIPKAKKNTYSSEYHIGKKSKYYQRENELISLWKDQGLSIQKINQLTGVGKRTLKKLLDPLGYDSKKMKRKSIKKALSIAHKQQTERINNQINKINLTPKEIEDLFNKHEISNFALKKSKEINVKPSNIIRELRKKLPNNFENSNYLPSIDQLTPSDMLYFQNNQETLHQYVQRLAYKQKVTKTEVTQNLYKINPEIFSPSWKKRIKNSLITQKTIDEIINLYVNKYWTINELVKKYDLSEKKVRKILKDNNVLSINEAKRNKRTYELRKEKIHISMINNPKQEIVNRNKIHKYSKVPHDYIGQISEPIWNLIEQQPGTLLVDKLINLTRSKKDILALLKTVEKLAGHKVALTSLAEYLPTFKGLGNWNRRISDRFKYDLDIKLASGSLSSYEERVNKFLHDLGVTFEIHNRTLVSKHEFDFYLPKQKLAIEISPLETHNSNKYKHFGQATVKPKSSKYHQEKCLMAKKNNVTLITLFSKNLLEPNWSTITKPLLKFLITKKAERVYYARQTYIKKIKFKQANQFLNESNIDGTLYSKYQFGIFDHNDQSLGVATFALPQSEKYKNQHLIELKQLCWQKDVQVRYGLSKMVAFAKRTFSKKYQGLLSYSNNDIGNGESYAKAGFKFVQETSPQLHFVNPKNPTDEYKWSNETISEMKLKLNTQKSNLQTISDEEVRKLLETELPHRTDKGKGYVAQYDCGRKCWVYKF